MSLGGWRHSLTLKLLLSPFLPACLLMKGEIHLPVRLLVRGVESIFCACLLLNIIPNGVDGFLLVFSLLLPFSCVFSMKEKKSYEARSQNENSFIVCRHVWAGADGVWLGDSPSRRFPFMLRSSCFNSFCAMMKTKTVITRNPLGGWDGGEQRRRKMTDCEAFALDVDVLATVAYGCLIPRTAMQHQMKPFPSSAAIKWELYTASTRVPADRAALSIVRLKISSPLF